MALFSIKLENLQQLFLKELRDLYDAEKQITDALPKMIDAAHHSELKNALQDHLHVTKQQISRLDRIFQILQEAAHRRNLQGHEGIAQRRRRVWPRPKATRAPSTPPLSPRRSAWSITRWPATARFAPMPSCWGSRQIAELLQQTLDEEKTADETLSDIASNVNVESKAA